MAWARGSERADDQAFAGDGDDFGRNHRQFVDLHDTLELSEQQGAPQGWSSSELGREPVHVAREERGFPDIRHVCQTRHPALQAERRAVLTYPIVDLRLAECRAIRQI